MIEIIYIYIDSNKFSCLGLTFSLVYFEMGVYKRKIEYDGSMVLITST